MSEFDKVAQDLIQCITQHIDLPAFVTLTSGEAKFLFGNNSCYDKNDTNYFYVDNKNGKFTIICSQTDQQLSI